MASPDPEVLEPSAGTAGSGVPSTEVSAFTRALGRFVIGVLGFRVVTPGPQAPKAVVAVFPHTSNWDFPVAVGAGLSLGVRFCYAGKHTLFRGPLGPLMRWLGGIPVDRTGRHDVVGQVVSMFDQSERMLFGIAPTGTRSYTDHWKSGFYQIALRAKVPVILCWMDYPSRTLGLAEPILLTGDRRADMERIRAVLAGKVGHTPAHQGPVRLRDET